MFNDFWMRDNGFSDYIKNGNLNDIITRRFSNNEVVYLKPDDLIKNAYQKMKLYDISQLPVVEGSSIVGIIDESDILDALISNADPFYSLVENFMSTNLVTLASNDKIMDVIQILSSGMVPIIVDKGRFVGLITKIDLIKHLNKNKIFQQ